MLVFTAERKTTCLPEVLPLLRLYFFVSLFYVAALVVNLID